MKAPVSFWEKKAREWEMELRNGTDGEGLTSFKEESSA